MDPLFIDGLIVKHALANGHATTRRQLLDLGVAGTSIDRRIESGLLETLGGGTLGLRGAPDPHRRQLHAAILHRPDAVIAFETAAALHGMPLGGRAAGCHLLVPITHSARSPVGTVHRTRHLPLVDRGEIDQLPVTTPERTFCDVAARSSFAFLRWLGEELVLSKKLDRETLSACASALNRRGRKGSTLRRLLMIHLCDDLPRIDSVAELRFIELCRRFDIDGLEPQLRPPWYDGRRGIVDFGCNERRRIVEIDGYRWHASTQALQEDRRRDSTARRHGWQVLRFSHDELVNRPSTVADEVRSFLDPTPGT
jgi:hypothetical protein